jgi:hypothetical protein
MKTKQSARQRRGRHCELPNFLSLARTRPEAGSPSWRQILLPLRLANGTQAPTVDLRWGHVGGAVALKLSNLQRSRDGGGSTLDHPPVSTRRAHLSFVSVDEYS